MNNFDGPLDLLLHLIKSQEMNIFSIKMQVILSSYLAFLDDLPRIDFHAASEYLAMAAQLVEIKAQMLLPSLTNTTPEATSLEEMASQDPRRPLVEQLLEYEAIRQTALQFEARLTQFTRFDTIPSGQYARREEEFSQYEHPIQGHGIDLLLAFERVLLGFSKRSQLPKVRVEAQKITLEHTMTQVYTWLGQAAEGFLLWEELVTRCTSRYELVVLVLALLELAKTKILILKQDQAFGPIWVQPGVQNA